jgi:hemolysin activation/secretion protein
LFRLQKITNWFSIIGKAQGQYAFHELVVSEQFALGGQDTVRGYAPFEFMGDRGYAGTLEARFSLPFLESVKDPIYENRSLVDMFQIVGFIDSGTATRIHPLPGERRKNVLTGAGTGVRIYYPDWVSIRFDVAWPISDFESSSHRDRFYYVSVILNLH